MPPPKSRQCVALPLRFDSVASCYFTTGPTGFAPYYGVARDSTGNLYGTTLEGGNNACDCGVVFEQEATGTYTVLHKFSGGDDGSMPYGGLLHVGEYLLRDRQRRGRQ